MFNNGQNMIVSNQLAFDCKMNKEHSEIAINSLKIIPTKQNDLQTGSFDV